MNHNFPRRGLTAACAAIAGGLGHGGIPAALADSEAKTKGLCGPELARWIEDGGLAGGG